MGAERYFMNIWLPKLNLMITGFKINFQKIFRPMKLIKKFLYHWNRIFIGQSGFIKHLIINTKMRAPILFADRTRERTTTWANYTDSQHIWDHGLHLIFAIMPIMKWTSINRSHIRLQWNSMIWRSMGRQSSRVLEDYLKLL